MMSSRRSSFLLLNIVMVGFLKYLNQQQSKAIADEINGKAVQIAPLAPDYIDNLKKIAAEIIGSNK